MHFSSLACAQRMPGGSGGVPPSTGTVTVRVADAGAQFKHFCVILSSFGDGGLRAHVEVAKNGISLFVLNLLLTNPKSCRGLILS